MGNHMAMVPHVVFSWFPNFLEDRLRGSAAASQWGPACVWLTGHHPDPHSEIMSHTRPHVA